SEEENERMSGCLDCRIRTVKNWHGSGIRKAAHFPGAYPSSPEGIRKINRCTVNERSSESSIAICKKLF
nr:hypothetical protein [Gammaproteobacteria bacterium]